MKETFNFGYLLEFLKQGGLAARMGWNGKGMFIFMRPGDLLQRDFIIDTVKSLPADLKTFYSVMRELDKEADMETTQAITFTPYLCMKAADGSIVNGWLASQTDMLATDWCIVDPIEAANGSHAIANAQTK